MRDFRVWISNNAVASIALLFAAVLIFLIVPAVWFRDHGGGEYFGAIIGFGALLAGALLNAHLSRQNENENRRTERERDDRLHARELFAATFAIQFELATARTGLKKIETTIPSSDQPGVYLVIAQLLPMLSSTIFHRNVEKLMGAIALTDGKINPNAIIGAPNSVRMAHGIIAGVCDQNRKFTQSDKDTVNLVVQNAIKSIDLVLPELGKIIEWINIPLYAGSDSSKKTQSKHDARVAS